MPHPVPPRAPRSSALRRSARLLLAALALLPATASAQYFGRNKVAWERFDWRVLETEHFDIHYYPQEETAVRDAARMAERWYGRLSSVFGRKLSERKPIILYADQSDFQQTVVTGGLIGQGTGGFTEPLRNRVVLPLTGDYQDTDHVLGHELVHVFQFEILEEQRNTPGVAGGTAASSDVPLWAIEGLAEYLSLGRESPQTAMWLRDAFARDDLPDLAKLSRNPRYFPYRWGHAFWAYVGGRWGDSTAASLFTAMIQIGVEPALVESLGLTSEAFSKEWRAAIRDAYAPLVERRQTAASAGRRIVPREGESRESNIAPALSPDGDLVAFLSTRGLFSFDLYLADSRTGELRGKLLSADADPHFDALRFLDSAGAWSPDGKKFAVVVFAEGDNQIAIVDVGSRSVERRIGVSGVGSMWNPAWSPDGRTLAFSGSAGGITDLYLLDVASGETRRLTDDRYADLQPAWSPDGRTIAFASDRGAETSFESLRWGPMGIWLVDVGADGAGGAPRPAPGQTGAAEEGDRINPQFGPDGGSLYFLSDRGGVSDVYRLALASGEVTRLTHVATGVTGITRLSPAISVAARSGRIGFSVFNDTGYQIHTLEPAQPAGETVPAAAEPRAALLPPVDARRDGIVSRYLQETERPGEPAPPAAAKVADYRPRLRLDYVAPAAGVSYSTFGYAVGGDLTAFFSDMLGQYQLGVSLQGGSSQLNDFGGQAFFLNQAHRFQWGAAAGHIPYVSGFTTVRPTLVDVGGGQQVQGRVIEQVLQTVTEDQATLISQYPFSATRRLEGGIGITRLGFSSEVDRITVVGDTIVDRDQDDLPAPSSLSLYQGSVAFVGDNSFFGFTSPVRGRRYRLEVSPTFGDLEFQSATADYRRYFFFRPLTLAVRGLHFGRYGTDAESDRLAPLYLGRPTLVRGYEIDSFDISECTAVADAPEACPEFDRLVGSRIAVANLELRIPLFGTESFGLVELPFLPTELSLFVDSGAAWSKGETPDLRFATRSPERIPVVSAGVSARLLLGGFAVLEFYYAKPFQRPEENFVFGFTIAPGW